MCGLTIRNGAMHPWLSLSPLKNWNKAIFGNAFRRKRDQIKRMERVEEAIAVRITPELLNEKEVNLCKIWKRLWKCECPEKVRYFLWKINHDCIMTEVQRKKRGISIFDVCKRCGLAAESTTHAIRDCVWVRGIWEMLVKRDKWATFFSLDIKSWVENNISKNWGVTNDGFILRSYWCSSDDISCGGVIRNSHGDWITGFTKKLGKGMVFQAELWGALLGLKSTWDLHLPRVILETDSALVYNFITNGCRKSSPAINMARKFKDLLAKDWMVHIKHVHRDMANILATSAHFYSFGLISFDRVPDFCKATFLDDHNRVLAAHRLGS
ncbi:reverse transcriptase [Senna tora]|uniref:Reverse transcriptase n=1 Tax=Senna tora TaxID=362788 RepID=A0A834U302_9FABA|nr:reverse transcriptase [Senna tora]